jgi:hypothetical protein
LLADFGFKICPKFEGKNLSENFSAEIELHKIGPKPGTGPTTSCRSSPRQPGPFPSASVSDRPKEQWINAQK